MKTKTLFAFALVVVFSFASCVSSRTRTTVYNDEESSAHIDEDGDFVWDDYAN